MKRLLIASLITLAGCASAPQTGPSYYATMDPKGIAASSKAVVSKFSENTWIEAPAMRYKIERKTGDIVPPVDDYLVLLRGLVSKDGKVTHQAYVNIDYSASTWRHYSSANLAGGKFISAVPVETKVLRCGAGGRCDFREVFAVPLDEAALRSSGDVEFRLNSKAEGEDVVTLPRNYIDGYLLSIKR